MHSLGAPKELLVTAMTLRPVSGFLSVRLSVDPTPARAGCCLVFRLFCVVIITKKKGRSEVFQMGERLCRKYISLDKRRFQ